MRPMKDSGIEWIGEIPQSWELRRIKTNFSIASGATPKSGEASYWDGDIPWITPADYTTDDKYVSAGHKSITQEGLASCATSLIPAGSIIFSKRAPVGLVAISNNPLCTNQGCLSCIPKDGVDVKYHYYVMSIYGEQFDLLASGTTFKEISADTFANFKLQCPNYDTQKQIATFLDNKCAEIDALIDIKKKTNALLKERRQSIIYEAVTKGLDPTVPMKDSGVEWIGEIPEGWRVYRLKYLLDSGKDSMKAGPFGSSLTATDMQGSDVKVFNQRTVLDGDFESGDEFVSNDKASELKGFLAREGDILITTRGTIGKTVIVPDGKKGIIHPCLIKMRINSDLFSRELLCRIFNETNILSEQLKLASNATTIEVIYTQNLLDLYIPVPSIEEQTVIEQHLKTECSQLDLLINNNYSSIQKLKEYRQSLIYEAVTGKKEIR